MVKNTTPFTNIDEYIALQPVAIQPYLQKLRQVINKAAPKAEEVISYQMPAFALQGGVLVYFGAFKNHCGFFPTSQPIVVFKDRLTEYKLSKGTIQFTLDHQIPDSLLKEIILCRLSQYK